MKFYDVIDLYVKDMLREGRFRGSATERGYRSVLYAHAEDVGNRDPRYIGREDVKRTLGRWNHPTTQSVNRAKLVSFYDWFMQEGYRKDNPASATRPVRRRPVARRRLTEREVAAILEAAAGVRERRAIYLMACAGLRRAELLGLKGLHLAREGLIVVTADIAKGGHERVIPVVPELEPVVREIRASVGSDEYVLPAQRWRDPGQNRARIDLRYVPSSPQALGGLIEGVALRAGVTGRITAHAFRHAFADQVTRAAGVYVAQHVLGHADIATTQIYLSRPRLEDLVEAVKRVSYGAATGTNVLGVAETLRNALEATTGIEPV